MVWLVLALILLAGCGSPAAPKTEPMKRAARPPQIALFYTSPAGLIVGQTGELCYSVENTTKVSLDPPVDRVWPALTRCLEIKPTKATTYTLTAENADGVKVTATTEVSIHAAPAPGPKIIDISANPAPLDAGQGFQFCVHGRNAKNWTISAGKWLKPPDARGGCVVDQPAKTTTYVVNAIGDSGARDTMQVVATVK